MIEGIFGERLQKQFEHVRIGDAFIDVDFIIEDVAVAGFLDGQIACQMLDFIEYLADILTVGTLEQRAATVKNLMKDGMIGGLEEKVRRDCAKERRITGYGENERIAG